MSELFIIQQYSGVEHKEICKQCGGECCKTHAGLCSPSDFGNNPQTIARNIYEYIKTGFWAIDWWEGDPRIEIDEWDCIYYVRPKHIDAKHKILDPSCGGTCILWTEKYGCSLRFENRPYECRHLVPSNDFKCSYKNGHTKEKMAIKWVPFQTQMRMLIEVIELREPESYLDEFVECPKA